MVEQEVYLLPVYLDIIIWSWEIWKFT